MKYILNSEKETFEFSKDFAGKLKGGEIIGLVGNLGAGKTVFSRGLAAGLDIKNKITSPTFVLMKVYEVKRKNIKYFCHIDAYRLRSAQDLLAIGADDYLGKADTITLIEWADKIKTILPPQTRIINIKIQNGTKREISC